jgi:hypothetical protein
MMDEPKVMYRVYRTVSKEITDSLTRVTTYYLDDDGKWVRSPYAAKLFKTFPETDQAIRELKGDYRTQADREPVKGRQLWYARKAKLKHQAKKLFRLPVNIPACLVADRYEEEGMLEEAAVLRAKK